VSLFGLFDKKQKPIEVMKTSPGKLKTYMQCPMKYKFLHVENRTGRKLSAHHLSFDGILKQAVEEFQKKTLMKFEDIQPDELSRMIEANWDPARFEGVENAEEFREAARKAGRVMTQWFADNRAFLFTHRREPALGVFAEYFVQPISVWVRLDRIERMPEGNLRLVIFKSGARQILPQEMKYDLGIRLQMAAARELFGDAMNRFAFVYLRDGNTIEIPIEALDLEALPAELLETIRKIQDGDFDPHLGPLCSVCEFLEECPGWPEMPWKRVGEDRETYGKRLRMSYSKMSLFERCPRAYSKLYIEKIAPKPQPFFSFGSCIHAVMETFYDKNNDEKRSLPYLMRVLDETWPGFRIGYTDDNEESRYREKAVTMLEQYYNRFVKSQKFFPASQIESYFEIPVGGDTVMTGFIDRIDARLDGGYTVLDYKTEPTDRSQDAVDKDLQLTLYYWAAREWLRLDIRELGLFMMSFDKLMTTTRSPDQIPGLLERVEAVTRQIRAETVFAPRVNKYCLSCDHLNGCPIEETVRSDGRLRTMEFTEDDV